MDLKDFSPAHTLMLLEPSKVLGKELFKYSFLDLVYRGILQVKKEWRKPHKRDPRERLYTLVSRGPLFSEYQESAHQNPFIAPFRKSPRAYQLRILLHKVFKESKGGVGFKQAIVYRQLRAEGVFSSSLGLKRLNLFFLSGDGRALKTKFEPMIQKAERSLPLVAGRNALESKKIIQQLGPNILLLDCFTDHLIEKLKPIFKELGSAEASLSQHVFLNGEDLSELLFSSFLDTIDQLDFSFDSFESYFDAGLGDLDGGIGGGDFGLDFGGFE